MLALLEQAKGKGGAHRLSGDGAHTYFPKKIRKDFDQFFETEMPPKALEPLLRRAKDSRIAYTRASARKPTVSTSTRRSSRMPRASSAGRSGRSTCRDEGAGRLRPGLRALLLRSRRHGLQGVRRLRRQGRHRHLPGPPLPESYRALALQGAEIILIGYNTPISALALDLNELCMRAGAYAMPAS